MVKSGKGRSWKINGSAFPPLTEASPVRAVPLVRTNKLSSFELAGLC